MGSPYVLRRPVFLYTLNVKVKIEQFNIEESHELFL